MTRKLRVLSFVLLGLLVPTGGFFLRADAPPSPDQPKASEVSRAPNGPAIVVEAVYPGANAQVVYEIVAQPIEQQILGMEKVQQLFSRCTNDGHYTLVLRVEQGVDLDVCQLLVQNRVALALPQLPAEVQNEGLTVRKQGGGGFLFVSLFSPDERYDALYLSNYAAMAIRDEVVRLPGAASVALLGDQGSSLEIKLDHEKLSLYGLTAEDVRKALRQHGFGGGEAAARLLRSGKETLDKLDTIVVGDGPAGRVYLRDVALLGVGRADRSAAFLDGKPVVVLRLSATSPANEGQLRTALLERMQKLKESFPPGVDYSVAFDLFSNREVKARSTTPSYLLAEPLLPSGGSPTRAQDVLKRYSAILQEIKGVQHVLSLQENPFGRFVGGPCVVVQLAPDLKDDNREQLLRTVRSQLDKVLEAELRLSELTRADSPRQSVFSVDLALRGPEQDVVLQFGKRFTERLERSGRLIDLSGGPERKPAVRVDIDRDKAAALGVSISDLTEALRTYLGADAAGEFQRFGRTVQVQLQCADPTADTAKDIRLLKIRNNQGQMVRLSTLVTVHDTTEPAYLDRLDGQQATFISANPKPKLALAEARWLCEKLAEETRKELHLPAEYRLVWMKTMPAAKPLADEPKAADPPPLEVAVTRPVEREVTDYLDLTGRLDAVQSVDLRSRVTGFLVRVHFKEGSEVKKGDLLYEIDTRPYQARLDQVLSQVKLDEALLELAKVTLNRDVAAEKGKVDQQQIDLDRAAVKEASARLAAAKATVEVEKLNVDWTQIRSPIDGQIGRTYLTEGNLVEGDKTILASVVSRDPVYVYFDMDELTYLKFAKARDKEQTVLLKLASEEGYPRKGKINLLPGSVNPNTGAVTMRAVLDNRDKTLLPGMFARVRVPLGAPHKVLLVPDEAVRNDQGVKYLYVLDKENKVVDRPVTVGALQGDGLRVIEDGLKAEDRVVFGGKRVRSGMTVKPVETESKPPDSKR